MVVAALVIVVVVALPLAFLAGYLVGMRDL